MTYTEKRILVLGLGESGLAMARWIAYCGGQLRVADTRATPERLSELRSKVPDAEFIGAPGNHVFPASLLENIDLITVSPGLTPHTELVLILPAAAAKNIPVWSEVELFVQALTALHHQENYTPKIIAITGTNGKTTVTRLTGLLCERAGLKVQVAGNISPSLLTVLLQALKQKNLPEVWVLELSSFQLHHTYSLQPNAATVLNLTEDHLDWHGDFASYCADKARIFAEKTVRVLNRNDAVTLKMAAASNTVVTFGTDEPVELDCLGIVQENGLPWLAIATNTTANVNANTKANKSESESENISKAKRASKKKAAEVTVTVNRLMPAGALRIHGQHNALNALAALGLCRAIGLPLAPLLHAVREYRGEPHRLELVTVLQDVAYYDDSKGTNVGATVAALQSLGFTLQASQKHIILIAGGDGKGQDFKPLITPVLKYVKALLLIGKDALLIRDALLLTALTPVFCSSLEEAVEKAAGMAQSKDMVLLSPACASLDMFVNYEHRARVFRDSVFALDLMAKEERA